MEIRIKVGKFVGLALFGSRVAQPREQLIAGYQHRKVGGSNPPTATILVLSFLLLHFLFDSILPSREARQFFHEDIYSLKYPIMQKKSFIEDEEVKMILRQLGFGAALGTAFLMAIYFGGLLAKLCSGM